MIVTRFMLILLDSGFDSDAEEGEGLIFFLKVGE